MDRALAGEVGAALASARELLREALEEGVEHFERASAASRARPDATPQARVVPTAPSPARTRALASAPAPAPAAAASAALAPAFPSGATLEEVRAALGECTRCALHAGRNRIVFGAGNPDADLVFVGEGPGEQEDLQGLPFVGPAGELLTQMIERGLGIPRRSVYICNIVKCRPPRNRTPLPGEVHTCRTFLDGQIDALRPKVIVALGKPATSLLLGREVSITRMRGVWQEYRGIALMPTFHPAFVLRQYTAEIRRLVWEDLKSALGRAQELGGRFDA